MLVDARVEYQSHDPPLPDDLGLLTLVYLKDCITLVRYPEISLKISPDGVAYRVMEITIYPATPEILTAPETIQALLQELGIGSNRFRLVVNLRTLAKPFQPYSDFTLHVLPFKYTPDRVGIVLAKDQNPRVSAPRGSVVVTGWSWNDFPPESLAKQVLDKYRIDPRLSYSILARQTIREAENWIPELIQNRAI